MPKIIIVHYEEDPEAIVKFKMDSNFVWNDHINYTRDLIISIIAGLEDVSALTDRLMKNQEDIGAILVPYYGAAAADTLTALLKSHVSIAGEFIKAAKSQSPTDAINTRWQANAADIATYLDALDSENWPKDTVLTALNSHMGFTLKEVVARLSKDWPADIQAYDDVHAQICKLAEVFACGIVYKFPDKFVKYDCYDENLVSAAKKKILPKS